MRGRHPIMGLFAHDRKIGRRQIAVFGQPLGAQLAADFFVGRADDHETTA